MMSRPKNVLDASRGYRGNTKGVVEGANATEREILKGTWACANRVIDKLKKKGMITYRQGWVSYKCRDASECDGGLVR